MESRLAKLSQRLYQNIEATLDLWSDTFGTNLFKVWSDVGLVPKWKDISDALQNIVKETKKVLDINNERDGHVSLFLRDPLSDRLILINSTNEALNPGSNSPQKETYIEASRENYDPDQKVFFYRLCDRLTPENQKKSPKITKTRGLTGWVAVTGHPLRINSERAKTRLEDIPKDNPKAAEMCAIYGTPSWGNRIAEFPQDFTKDWSKRFLAFPVKSVTNPSNTIGVIRYTCTLETPELSQLDLIFLECITNIIAAIKNMERIKNLTIREAILPQQLISLSTTGDFYKFLEFISISLRSRISSAYIYLNLEDGPILRLVNAYGISGEIDELRRKNQIKDYTEETRGLTLELLKLHRNNPERYESVLRSDYWEGLNTKIFYQTALSNLGIKGIRENLENHWKTRELLKTYSIKLMGMGIEHDGQPLGVLKVEFPSTYDDSEHYDDSDEQFFRRCCEKIKKELKTYQDFIHGAWFEDANERKIQEFIKTINQILLTQLVSEQNGEFPLFWQNVRNYSNQYKKYIGEANESFFEKLPKKQKKIFMERILKKMPRDLIELLFSKGCEIILKSL